MMRRLLSGAALAAVITTGALAQQSVPAAKMAHAGMSGQIVLAHPRGYKYEGLPATKALLDGYVRADKIPGVVAMIGTGDAPPYLVQAGQLADGPGGGMANEKSLWRIYSMTKPITAMAAMMLIEEGKIGLDQPVSDFIPAFKNLRVQIRPDSLDSRPATRVMTIRHLLTHTAGLGYTITTKGPLLKAYEKGGITPFTADAKGEVAMRRVRQPTLEAFANKVATLPLIAEPGTRWSYSIGLDVMGRVIEVAGRMPFDKFLQRRIFDPLRMRSTCFTVPAADARRLATGYVLLPQGRVPIDPGATSVFLTPPTFPYGGAGLVSSAEDYDRFLHMLQNGGTLDGTRILKPATVKLAMSNLLPAGVFYPGAVAATGGTPNPQGFGAGGSVTLRDVPGGPARGTYGWGGAAGTIAWVDPVNRIRATVMVNYLPGDRWPLRAETTRSIYADLMPTARPLPRIVRR